MIRPEPPPAGFDPTDWKAPATQAWAFRHTDAFLPHRIVPAAVRPRALPRAIRPDPPGWATMIAPADASAVIAVTDGVVHHEEYRPPMRVDDRHMLFSVTKSVFGLIARILIDQGAVTEARRVVDYLPDFRGTAFADATLGALLAMRDGVAFDESYADPRGEIHRYSSHYWRDAPGGTRAALKTIGRRAPIDGFAYRTPVADMIGWVLRAATGARLGDLLGELLWVPIGAAHPAHLILDTAGDEIAGTGLNAVPEDLARLAAMLSAGGGVGTRQVMAEASVARMFGPVQAIGDDAERRGWGYRDLWWQQGDGVIGAIGVHGQRLLIDARTGTAMVKTAWRPSPSNDGTHALHREMLRMLGSAVTG
ncbi:MULTISPECIES: serine hydrolase domain-containing protein [unclassified Sphingomonas]|uniref:serine hydrolase domain-containing protein n=1 Tax=unclassified Sphingomonas TaxID=196159 RepID=UPI000834F4B7|nr:MULTISPECIES: serine hydrolase domain-containing protein [unclassified Sphingomonas]